MSPTPRSLVTCQRATPSRASPKASAESSPRAGADLEIDGRRPGGGGGGEAGEDGGGGKQAAGHGSTVRASRTGGIRELPRFAPRYDATRLSMRLPRPTNPLLSGRDGRLFLSAQALDALAVGISAVALPWLVLDGGGSAGAAGLVATMALVPYVLFGLIAGVAGDRFGRAGSCCSARTPCRRWPRSSSRSGPSRPARRRSASCWRRRSSSARAGCSRMPPPSAPSPASSGARTSREGQAMLSAAWSIGLVAGPAAGGALIAAIGAGEALVARVRRLRPRRGAAPADARPPRRARADRPQRAPGEALLQGCASSAASPSSSAFFVMASVWNIVAAGVLTLLVPLLGTRSGSRAHEAGWALAIGAAMGVVAAPLVGPLDRRFGGVTIVLWGVVVNGVTALASAWLGASGRCCRRSARCTWRSG